jgi:DNA-binding NarL/FixJ family response regulator
VLLVDDAAHITSSLHRWLSLEPGIEVVGVAHDAAGGVDAARSLQPDICVMDVRMPGGDGIEATAAMKRAAPRCRVIILTLYDEQETRARADRAGAAAFTTKTEHPSRLLAAIRQAAAS